MEENLKKAVTEFLVLRLLSEREYYIGELTDTLREKSRGALSIVFPYSAIYRLLEAGFIGELKKRTAPDGRRRQYYAITPLGKTYLQELTEAYGRFTDGVRAVLEEGGEKT